MFFFVWRDDGYLDRAPGSKRYRRGLAQATGSLFVFLIRSLIRRGCRIGIGAWRARGRLVGPGFGWMLADVHLFLRGSGRHRSTIRVPEAKKRAPLGCQRRAVASRLRLWSLGPFLITSCDGEIYNLSVGSARK